MSVLLTRLSITSLARYYALSEDEIIVLLDIETVDDYDELIQTLKERKTKRQFERLGSTDL